LSEVGHDPSAETDFENLFEDAPCGYLSLSADGRIVRANRTFAGWIGRSAAELTGMALYDLLPIAGRMYFETHLKPSLRMQGFVNEVALELLAADGHRIPVIANALERRDPAGEPLFTRITFFVAVERRRYERNLLAARDAAETASEEERRRSELRDQFIAVLGHDLRNPLASVIAGTRLLRKEPLSEKGFGFLDLMHASAMRMSGLIDNVLDFARGRLGGGLVVNRSEPQSLELLLRHVVDELRAAAPGRVIEADLSVGEPVACDRSRIGQLVSNLLGNALTHGSPDGPIRLIASTADGMLEITVANTGAPIPPEAMGRLFQPFFRGGVRQSREGLGLGLYIASEIARAHDGVLNAESTPAQTRFTFRMPIRPSENLGAWPVPA
jgi:sigma-B regulation protein RsbU (phosphoserine phosphatase)